MNAHDSAVLPNYEETNYEFNQRKLNEALDNSIVNTFRKIDNSKRTTLARNTPF